MFDSVAVPFRILLFSFFFTGDEEILLTLERACRREEFGDA